MSKKPNDIDDNEIRIISASSPKEKPKSKFTHVYLPILAAIVILGVIIFMMLPTADEAAEDEPLTPIQAELVIPQPVVEPKEVLAAEAGRVVFLDTTINRKGLKIFYPENLRPRLVIGSEALNDSSIMLATQAADIRRDNGKIAGTFVMKGEVISKGEAKAGFCSIINGELTIGISDATPMFEQSLTDDGYFFRQYPLVVGGQLVENKPKGKAIRKALADLDGKICVVMSKDKLTFGEFSQLLIDIGVRNAIYLVGSSSYGFYINADGEKILTGIAPTTEAENVSYIIWESN